MTEIGSFTVSKVGDFTVSWDCPTCLEFFTAPMAAIERRKINDTVMEFYAYGSQLLHRCDGERGSKILEEITPELRKFLSD